MSGKRIVEETPCEFETGVRHVGCDYSAHIVCNKCGWIQGVHPCTERRILTEGQYVLIEKVDEAAFVDVWADIIHAQHGCPSPGRCSGTARTLLDALSDHTEGTP